MTSSKLYCEKNIWHYVASLSDWDVSTMETKYRVHWSSTLPQKPQSLFFAKILLNLQTVYTPPF